MKPRSIPTHTVSRATLLATSLGLAVVAHAAEPTITKADNADALNLGSSWSGGIAPGASEIGLWDSVVTSANATVLGGDLSWAGIQVVDPGGAVSIGAGNTLTLGSAGIDMSLASQNLTLANALALGAAQTWNVSVGQTLTVSGAMSGAGGIAKSGPGTLLLSGGNASYSGPVAINDGILQLNGGAALGTGNAITIGASGSIDPTLTIGVGGVTHALGAIDVPASVSGARISMPQNSGTRSHTIAGATLASPLTVAQSNTSGSNWSQVTWTSKITGIGGGAGNDTLVFHNTGGTQNYYTTNNGAAHDFSGNIHLKGGLIAVQSQTPNGNLTIPDASMLWVEAGEWRSNNGGMVETIDGLRGAGTMGNPQNLTLTINANNSANDGNRSFSGTLGNMGGALTLGGSGLQEFTGNRVTYTNATNLNNGTLKLTNTTAWGSSITMGASNSPKVQLNAPLVADAWDFRKVVSGGSASASLEKTGDGTVTLPASQTFTGTTVVSGGTLKMQSTDYPVAMPSIPGMKVWLDAADPEGDGDTTVPTEGAAISTWKNKGNLASSADFTASTSGTNPPTYTSSIAAFNNKPAITFNAATGKLLANTVNYGNNVSVVYVGRVGATKARLVSGGTQNWILGYHGGNMNANWWNTGSTGTGTPADSNPHIWINGATNGSFTGHRFDAAGEANLATGNASHNPTAGLTLGGAWNVTTTPTEKSDGDIAELFVFDHQLTTTERAQLEGYLYNKYFGSQFPSAITSLNAAGSVSVAGGASFGGYGTAGSTTVAAGGTILAGNPASGSLTLSGLALNGAATVVGTPTATAAPLVVNGTLATAGSNTVNLVVPASLTVGTHHLIQYNTLSGSLGDFKFPAPVRSMTIAHNAPYIDVVVSPTVAFPVWTGTGGGEWSYGAGLDNWKLSSDSSATDFMANDAVLFDDTVGAGSTAISVGVSNISPGVITFNNSSTNYSLTQANGMDINSGSLVKSGTGTLTISGSFTFAGGASLNGGLVSVDSPGSLGTGGRSFNGGTLEYNGATGTMAGTTTLNAGGGTINVTSAEATLTFGGALGGTGALVKTGAGSLITPLATGTYANAIEINGGTLGLSYGSNAVILTGPISGSAGVLRLDGTGANATSGLTFTGANTFTGETHIYGRRIFLDRTGGNAINGDIVFMQANWPYHDLSLNQNEQIADTALLRWEQPAGQDVYEFRLNGKTETVAGLVSTTTSPAIIENAGHDGGNDNNIPAGKLIVNTPTGADYSYSGSLRNQNGGSGNGALSFEKQGPGTQTLIGGFSYTGSTTVSGGKLVLQDSTTPFASSDVTVAAGAALEIRRTTGTGSTPVPIAGAGDVIKSGAGLTTLTGNQSYTGTTTITEGTLSITGSLASPVIDVQALGGLSTTTVGNGTTVTGNGALVGVTFGSGSTLSPGSTGTPIDTPMLGDGTITFTAGSTCAMNVDRTGGIITSDRLEGMDGIVYAGTLTVTATGQAFLAGDVVSLFPGAASYGGGFTTTNLPALGSGLSWDLSKLTVDGSIQVVSFAPTPVFNPPAGGYVGAQTVTISSAAGSTIYYTLDGSTPTLSSPNGPSPVTGVSIPTNSTVTVKAFAKKTGQANSPVTTSVYNTLDLPVWTYDGTGSWQDSVNWQSGVLAQGNGVTADFSTLTTGGVNEVWLDGPRTVGQLAFGDQGNQFGWTLSAGSGGTLTLNNGASSPVVNVINQTATISAPVASGNGLVKTGAGTLVLNDVNAINGALAIHQGTLEANNAGALGSATNAVTLGDASTGANSVGLSFGNGVAAKVNLSSVTNSNFGTAQQITLNAGSGLPANDAALTTELNLSGSVPVTLKAMNTGGHSTAQDVNWRITGTGIPAGTTALILDGSTHTLRTSQMNNTSAASAFTGDVLIKGPVTTQGRTYLANAAENQNLNFLQNNVTVASGTWQIVWGGETIGALNGAGNVNLNCQSALNNIGLTLGNNNVAGTHTGVISGGFALSKVGTANQTLGGANTYSGGTTVNAGTLTLTNTTGSGTGSGAVTVKSGATLAGTGSASNTTTVESGGTVAPGTSGTGTLTLATASAAGTYQCQLDGANGDRLTVTGTLTIQPGAAINVSTLGTPTAASYTILSYATLTGTLPTITGVPEGYSVDTTTTGQVKLVSANAFDSWINGFASLTDPADKTPEADPDHDGLANVVEFVLNGNPANGAITNLPTLTASGANLVFTFTRRDDSESLNPTVEFDADLSGVWTTAVDGSNCTIVVTENDANPDTVTVTIPKQANAKLFARLRVNP